MFDPNLDLDFGPSPAFDFDPSAVSELPVAAVRCADVIVVGSGVAGLTAALGLAGRRVTLLTKGRFEQGGGSSPWAQGGVAAALSDADSSSEHAADTLAVGGGLNERRAVEILCGEGPEAVRELIRLGARFDRDPNGELALAREAAHGRRRILHARDATGAEIVRALLSAVSRAPEITIFEEAFAWELALHAGRVIGLVALHPGGRAVLHLAPAVVLATGGCGRVYSHSTNPVEVTGDGIAMAARAGARLIDMEFVQFHPTALDVGADPMPLVTEALRGEGATLIDERGRRFMPALHPDAELAPRDVVARGIWREMAEGRRPMLDAREHPGEHFPSRFPTVFALCQAQGIDPRREPIPVAPAAHYFMGGIAVDLDGQSSLEGLWACGEAASSGAHGANRLASNSLLEALVFGRRVARSIERGLEAELGAKQGLGELPRSDAVPDSDATAQSGEPEPQRDALSLDPGLSEAAVDALAEAIASLRDLMWRQVGLVRDEAGLRQALEGIAALEPAILAAPPSPRAGEARNLLSVARLIAAAALARRESRGSHYRADHPNLDPSQAQRKAMLSPAALNLPSTPDKGAACQPRPALSPRSRPSTP